ncbi:hypothetical protein AAFN88_21370, partial [Pelagibius sp. CAU 1746]|uniref:hypothetical protein n=1 Tax=Pelagibius sp. CAU 1746 TaxID=3140370 RepID=UPI00325B39BB
MDMLSWIAREQARLPAGGIRQWCAHLSFWSLFCLDVKKPRPNGGAFCWLRGQDLNLRSLRSGCSPVLDLRAKNLPP